MVVTSVRSKSDSVTDTQYIY